MIWGLLAWFVLRRRTDQAASYATTIAVMIVVVVLGATLGSVFSETIASVLNERYGGALPVLLVGGGYAGFAWVARTVLRQDTTSSMAGDGGVRAPPSIHFVHEASPPPTQAPSPARRLSTFERGWLIAGIAATALLVAYPPWELTNTLAPAQRIGHAWIFTGPNADMAPPTPDASRAPLRLRDIEIATTDEIRRLDAQIRARSHVDYARLGHLFRLIVFVTGGGLAALRLTRREA